LIDIAPLEENADPARDARAIARELKKYDEALFRKPRWLVFNKTDLVQDPDARIKRILRSLRWTGPWFKVSALTGEGTREVAAAVHRFLSSRSEKPRRRRAA
jgi:GTP-binding protein